MYCYFVNTIMVNKKKGYIINNNNSISLYWTYILLYHTMIHTHYCRERVLVHKYHSRDASTSRRAYYICIVYRDFCEKLNHIKVRLNVYFGKKLKPNILLHYFIIQRGGFQSFR